MLKTLDTSQIIKSILVLLLFLLIGCVTLNDCGTSTSCFYEKLDKCEIGAKLKSTDSAVDGPKHVEILRKDNSVCILEYRSGPTNSTSLFWSEKDLVTYQCSLDNFDQIIDQDGLAPAPWIMLRMSGSEEACQNLAISLGQTRNQNFQ